MPAPDEGRQHLLKSFSGSDVARDGTGLDPDHPLPVLADALIIERSHTRGDRRRGGGRIGTQAKVRAEDIAFTRLLLQDTHRLLHGPVGLHLGLARAAIEDVWVKKGGNIDVGGVVKLKRAHLAQREQEEPVR